MYAKEEAKKNIKKLAESFGEKLDFIKTSGQYKEAHIEDEFIKPLFKYLNWNISNEGTDSSTEREFIVQAKGRKGKEPDYLLQLDNKPRFYIEAKHSKYYLGGKTEDKGKVKERTDYIWQAYTYSYSTQTRPSYEKVDFALLTDFEEFRFFDCTFAVKNPDLINNYCVLDWTFKDYIENFDKLWDYFERENIRNGSLEKLYINEKKIKENRIPPDKAFLLDLDDENNGWRIKLAKDIKKYHPDFSAEFITQSVQLILDRFIFMKVLADREIEEDYILTIVNKIQNSKDKEEGIVYEECRDIFEELDKTYNGSIFIRREELDKAHVSNKTILEILKNFLPENSRYNFKVIPVEILGTIYEQFLGKVVVTSDKRAKIDYKPEVRKAGGVYYTPDYIVKYIVEQTVGQKLNECKKYEDLLEIKICDPACGSGSFLIVAYDYLIKWTVKYFEKKLKNGTNGSELKGLTKEEKKLVYLDDNNNVRLTSKIKRDILQSCIYGVDIDSQAVEVTKMSLSLKALENTTHYEVHSERTLFHTTILPPLEANIKCGNSLIDNDIYHQQDLFNLSEQERTTINSLDWTNSFKSILKNKKGFDCIIGNPPYIPIEMISDVQKVYFANKFKQLERKYDSSALFLLGLLERIEPSGYLGFISSITWQTGENYSKLREYIFKKAGLSLLINLPFNIFKDAYVDTGIYIIEGTPTKHYLIHSFPKKEKISNIAGINFEKIPANAVLPPDYKVILNYNASAIVTKIQKSKTILLGDISISTQGLAGNMFERTTTQKRKNDFPFLEKGQVYRYNLEIEQESFTDMRSKPSLQVFYETVPKLLIRRVINRQDRLMVAYTEKKLVFKKDINPFILKNTNLSAYFILAVLNSKLISYIYVNASSIALKDDFRQTTLAELRKIPIPLINFDDNEQKKLYNSVVENAKKIVLLSGKLASQKSEKEIQTVKKEFLILDSLIDSSIYKLYNLTPEEIRIVEKENE